MYTRRTVLRLLLTTGGAILLGVGCGRWTTGRSRADWDNAEDAVLAVPCEPLPDGAVVMTAHLPKVQPERALSLRIADMGGRQHPVLLVPGKDGWEAFEGTDPLSGSALRPVRVAGRLFWQCPRLGTRYLWDFSKVISGPGAEPPRRLHFVSGAEAAQVQVPADGLPEY